MDKRDLFEVKDDEEQKTKLQDICDLLVAAGYFRARLKGLSAFDKVVGGIVWCLEMSAVDVDVNFLFRENLNIGEKIEITEKIVKVLISIKCQYSLEPHQIQGLDTVRILPVVQWLVKKAMETREIFAKHLQSVAAIQYQKSFVINSEGKKLKAPQIDSDRKFKLASNNEALPLERQVIATLMEYGNNQVNLLNETEIRTTRVNTGKKLETRAIAQHVSNLIYEKSSVITQAIEDYTQRHAEREGEHDELKRLQNVQKNTTEAIERVNFHINNQEQLLSKLKEKLSDLVNAQDELNKRKKMFLEMEDNRQVIEQLESLVRLNEELNAERRLFKSQCKVELEKLEARNESLRNKETAPANEEELKRQVNSVRQQLAGAEKTLGEKNLTLLKLRRHLDSIPSNAELNQYQRRFTELCAQVNEKQTELNGYYLLYNTLEDTKVFLNKQLSLLTSIHDNFGDSLRSSSTKSEFSSQMESIVFAIRQNKTKIEKQIEGLTEKQRELNRCLNRYAIEEVQYRETLKDIAKESERYRRLLSHLGDDA